MLNNPMWRLWTSKSMTTLILKNMLKKHMEALLSPFVSVSTLFHLSSYCSSFSLFWPFFLTRCFHQPHPHFHMQGFFILTTHNTDMKCIVTIYEVSKDMHFLPLFLIRKYYHRKCFSCTRNTAQLI